MKPLAWARVPDRIERLAALDRLAEPLQKAARTIAPQGSQLKDILSGTWLGHPLHPPLTDVVIGTWTSALLLDRLGGSRAEGAADRLVAAGILAAIPTAASGFSDWAELREGNRRVGTVHAVGNTAGLMLNMLSWSARRRGNRGAGIALSTAGYAIAGMSAWLGVTSRSAPGSASTTPRSRPARASGLPSTTRPGSKSGSSPPPR